MLLSHAWDCFHVFSLQDNHSEKYCPCHSSLREIHRVCSGPIETLPFPLYRTNQFMGSPPVPYITPIDQAQFSNKALRMQTSISMFSCFISSPQYVAIVVLRLHVTENNHLLPSPHISFLSEMDKLLSETKNQNLQTPQIHDILSQSTVHDNYSI